MKRRTVPLFLALALSPAVFYQGTAQAQWPPNGQPLCTARGQQQNHAVVSDGAGGVIVAWEDHRDVDLDIYVQRVSVSGTVQWAANGVALCKASGDQELPVIVSDGAGGAIVTWEDQRTGVNDIYAQRIDGSGNPLWTADGVPVCSATADQGSPQVAADGAGGAVIVWHDDRSVLASGTDIYAQRLDGGGAPQWAVDGVALCTALGDQAYPVIVADNSGAIVAWEDGRKFFESDIYAQRVNAAGVTQWTADGVPLCSFAGNQVLPVPVSDGAGGAIVFWEDARDRLGDIYGQRVSSAGETQWATDGVGFCTASGAQSDPVAIPDGAGGAFVVWDDRRGASLDIFAQRVDANGTPLWAAGGIAICDSSGDQYLPAMVGDGAGGVIIAWNDQRTITFPLTSTDIYVQRLNGSGANQWAGGGIPLTVAPLSQYGPRLVADGGGGAIAAWRDFRNGTDTDIYAVRVDAGGARPITTGVPPLAPVAFSVLPPFPNPAFAGTTITVWLTATQRVHAEVFDASGRLVRVLAVGQLFEAGSHPLFWDGRDRTGATSPHGVYFVRVRAGVGSQTQRLVILGS